MIRSSAARLLAADAAAKSSSAFAFPTSAESTTPSTPAQWNLLRLLEQEVRAMQDPGVKSKFADLGVEAVSGTPEEFGAFIRSEIVKWAKVIKTIGVQLD